MIKGPVVIGEMKACAWLGEASMFGDQGPLVHSGCYDLAHAPRYPAPKSACLGNRQISCALHDMGCPRGSDPNFIH